MRPNIRTLELLSAELSEFLTDHILDQDSVGELLYRRLPPGQERWLRDYSFRWHAAETLAPLAERALAAEDDSGRAFNAFYDALFPYMTHAQQRQWDVRSLKATQAELIAEAFRILGLPTDLAN